MAYNPYLKYSPSWWRYWLRLPRDIWSFFKRVWSYRKVLWNDNDFDYAAVLHLMRFKFHRLRKHMEDHAVIAHCEDNVAELAHVDVLLRNIIDEDPDDEWYRHADQWHHSINGDWDLTKCEAKKECTKAIKASMIRNQRNWHALWAHLDKYMGQWWD